MKKTLELLVSICILAVSCGPSKHAVHVEMRHPSKAGVDLSGKLISVIYLENDNKTATDFNKSMAEGFAYTLEDDYGLGNDGIGIYRMRQSAGSVYSSKDSLFNLLLDTGADVVFLFDTVNFGNMVVGGPSKVSYSTSTDSSYVSMGTIPFKMKLYCFDGMNQQETVQSYGGTSIARPEVYSDGKIDNATSIGKAWQVLGQEGWDAGVQVADSFKSRWKHEQYSIVYYDSQKWFDALARAEAYDWKGAMDIWMQLLDSKDLMKKSSAAYNISVACYMLGDYALATEWLDLSDRSNKLPVSDAMRKRIDARK